MLWAFGAISDTFSNTNQNIFTLLIPIAIIVTVGYSLIATVLRLLLGLSAHEADKTMAKRAKQANTTGNKIWSLLLLLVIVASTYLSIALNLHAAAHIYNAWGSSLELFAISLTIGLSAVQGDIYWFASKKLVKLDERQLQQRYEVVDTAYKIGAWIVLAGILVLTHIHSLMNSPKLIFIPYFNLALTIFALPLVVASFQKADKV